MRQLKLHFLGAARNVTGSRFLIESDGLRLLVDCGLYQEREFLARNWDPFSVPPDTIDAVLLTHAHLDHSGYLPKLVKDGFKGRVYCTEPTVEIARIILEDSARLQEEDAAFKKRRHEKERRAGPHPEKALYTVDDAFAVNPLFSPVRYGQTVKLGRHATARFHDAGHILGSASIVVKFEENGEARTLLFSGDLGRKNTPLLRDPESLKGADYVIVEATYGDRVHEPIAEAGRRLAEVISETVKRDGKVVIPSFAVERSQELLFLLKTLRTRNRIPHVPVFVDSPMAIDVTHIYERHPDLLDEDLAAMLHKGDSPFRFQGLTMVQTVDESKAINQLAGPAVIIAGSGMATGGRIKHHLANNIGDARSTVLFVGYQAQGTLGRQIVGGASPVRIHGAMHEVAAQIVQMDALSAHADRDDLLRWLGTLDPAPRQVFLVHGEAGAADGLAGLVKTQVGLRVSVPAYKQAAVLG